MEEKDQKGIDVEEYRKILEFRGLYLQEMIYLEDAVSTLISAHFCPEDYKKQNELMNLVLYSSSFGMKLKTTILCKLLKAHYSDMYESKEPLTVIFKRVSDLRNLFAHRDIDMNYTKGVRFMINTNPTGKNHQLNPPFHYGDLYKTLKDVSELTELLRGLIDSEE
jgi:hypothetical protein